MDREKLIISIMKDLDCTREDAEEVAEMEIKAKGMRRYEKAEEQKPRKKREIKLDEEKVEILDYIMGALIGRHVLIEENEWDFSVVTIANPQKEITFVVGENEYSLTLTRHRKKGT